jgi:hypothetical protein
VIAEEEPLAFFGFDYGTRPVVLVPGDVEFMDLLNRGFEAIGYGEVAQFGVLVDAPLLLMGFKNEVFARECFLKFAAWGDGDGDAVKISFVELHDGGFGMCVSQEVDWLLNHTIPKPYRDEIEPRIMIVGHLKAFPHQSDGYKWFKSVASNSPFVLAPQSVNGDLIKDLALRKRNINFYAEDEVPENSIEYALTKNRGATDKRNTSRPIPQEFRFSLTGIAERRREQLSRFFPVTIERLTLDESFNQITKNLVNEGFRTWQVVQAACNLSLRYVVPEIFDKKAIGEFDSITQRLLRFLVDGYQSLSFPAVPIKYLNASKLKRQIHADSNALLTYVKDEQTEHKDPNAAQAELAQMKLLDYL